MCFIDHKGFDEPAIMKDLASFLARKLSRTVCFDCRSIILYQSYVKQFRTDACFVDQRGFDESSITKDRDTFPARKLHPIMYTFGQPLYILSTPSVPRFRTYACISMIKTDSTILQFAKTLLLALDIIVSARSKSLTPPTLNFFIHGTSIRS